MANEENNFNEDEKSSMEYMYNELVRINKENFEINKLRIDKANSLITFNSAIIAILIIAPIQILITSCNYKPIVLLLFVPTILFGISINYALQIYQLRNFITIDSKKLFEYYWDSTKEELLTMLSATLSDNIDLNYDSYEKNKYFAKYNDSLNNSLNFFKYGLIALVVCSLIIVMCYLWNWDICVWNWLNNKYM